MAAGPPHRRLNGSSQSRWHLALRVTVQYCGGMSADDGMPSAAQVEAAEGGRATHPREPHSRHGGRLNWLRAGVLGANDGIVSVAGMSSGWPGPRWPAAPSSPPGWPGWSPGPMALGEYVSVSSQRDSERAEIKQEKRELADAPDAELTELTALYEAKGLSAATARTVATELTARRPGRPPGRRTAHRPR